MYVHTCHHFAARVIYINSRYSKLRATRNQSRSAEEMKGREKNLTNLVSAWG